MKTKDLGGRLNARLHEAWKRFRVLEAGTAWKRDPPKLGTSGETRYIEI